MKYLRSSQYPHISETDSKIWIIQLTSSSLISICSDPNGLSTQTQSDPQWPTLAGETRTLEQEEGRLLRPWKVHLYATSRC